MPMNSVESPVNRLTSSHTDPVTNTPAYKETSIHMKVLAEVGESPLPAPILASVIRRRKRSGSRA